MSLGDAHYGLPGRVLSGHTRGRRASGAAAEDADHRCGRPHLITIPMIEQREAERRH